jgi:hypothetical protein
MKSQESMKRGSRAHITPQNHHIPTTSQFLGPFLDALEAGNAPNFDLILKEIDAQTAEVESLRVQAASRVKELRAETTRLANEHRAVVRTTKKEFTSALEQVKALENKVASVSGKAIAMGQRLEKVEKQRRRAHEAESAIRIFEALRSTDEDVRNEALESIIKDGSPLESAALLRKLNAIAKDVKLQESQSVLESLTVLNERFEQSVIADFDHESELWQTTQIPDAIEGMRKCAAALVCFNGGDSCIQRYIATRPVFMDDAVMIRDEVPPPARAPQNSLHLQHIFLFFAPSLRLENRLGINKRFSERPSIPP